MKLANYADVPWRFFANPRQGRIEFKQMLCGTEGDPNNYCLVVSKAELDFVSPRHRHNFDQVRMSLENATNIGPRLNIPPGDVTYFPEGCYYGPQNQAEAGEPSLAMVVQFGGASGSGYMSMEQMERGALELAEQGSFDGGVYRAGAAQPGKPRNRDGYEAVWSHVNGRPLEYPKPRYGSPIFMHPQAYEWVPVPGQDGVWRKALGRFTERDVQLEMLRIEAGHALRVAERDAITLLFALDGAGSLGADEGQPWERWSALELAPRESVSLQARQTAEWLALTLPALRAA